MRKPAGKSSRRATTAKKTRPASRLAKPSARRAKAPRVAERSASVSYIAGLDSRLRDTEYAAAYVQAAIDEGRESFVIAVRDVLRAHRFSSVSEKTSLNREHLYRAFSKNGNPSLDTLWAVLDAVGLQFTVRAAGA